MFVSQSRSNGFAEADIFATPMLVPCTPGPSCPTPITAGSGPWGMATDRNDYLYFAERDAGRIGVYGIDAATNQGKTFEFATPSKLAGQASQPLNIVRGGGGDLWYTDVAADVIGKITAFDTKTNSVTITEYPLAAGSQPWGITAGPGGFVYFTEYAGNAVGRIDEATGAIETVALPNAGSGPRGITVDGSGIIWVAEADGNRIGQFLLLGFQTAVSFGSFAGVGEPRRRRTSTATASPTSWSTTSITAGHALSVLLNTTPSRRVVPKLRRPANVAGRGRADGGRCGGLQRRWQARPCRHELPLSRPRGRSPIPSRSC